MRSLIFALLLSLIPDASLVAGVKPRQTPTDAGSNRKIAQATPLTREYMIGEWVTRNVEFVAPEERASY